MIFKEGLTLQAEDGRLIPVMFGYARKNANGLVLLMTLSDDGSVSWANLADARIAPEEKWLKNVSWEIFPLPSIDDRELIKGIDFSQLKRTSFPIVGVIPDGGGFRERLLYRESDGSLGMCEVTACLVRQAKN